MNLIYRLLEWGWGVTKDSSQLPVHYLIDYWKIAPTPFFYLQNINVYDIQQLDNKSVDLIPKSMHFEKKNRNFQRPL